MTRLLRNVVILKSDDYAARGWCLFEYIVATMAQTIVCDELQHPKLVSR